MNELTLKSGDCARLDSFAGLIPCKVLAIRAGGITIQITQRSPHGAFRRGETLALLSRTRVVPLSAIYRSRQHCGQYRIRQFTLVTDPD